jgi:hypothetical protein
MTNSENVVYNMAGYYSEFPEGLSGGPLKYYYNRGGDNGSLYPTRFPNGVPSGIPGEYAPSVKIESDLYNY